jgi:hypothetical protein
MITLQLGFNLLEGKFIQSYNQLNGQQKSSKTTKQRMGVKDQVYFQLTTPSFSDPKLRLFI